MWSKVERDFWIYEDRLKAQRDQASLLQDAYERGVLMGQIHAYQELLKQPPTPGAELAALSPEELTALLAQLDKQLLPDGV